MFVAGRTRGGRGLCSRIRRCPVRIRWLRDWSVHRCVGGVVVGAQCGSGGYSWRRRPWRWLLPAWIGGRCWCARWPAGCGRRGCWLAWAGRGWRGCAVAGQWPWLAVAAAGSGRGWTPPALAVLGGGGLVMVKPGACCVQGTLAEVRWLVLPFSSSVTMLGWCCLGGGAGSGSEVGLRAVSGLFRQRRCGSVGKRASAMAGSVQLAWC
jgi:hypothetical protein